MKMSSITEVKIKIKDGTVKVTDDMVTIEDLDGFKILEAIPTKLIKVKKEMKIIKI